MLRREDRRRQVRSSSFLECVLGLGPGPCIGKARILPPSYTPRPQGFRFHPLALFFVVVVFLQVSITFKV